MPNGRSARLRRPATILRGRAHDAQDRSLAWYGSTGIDPQKFGQGQPVPLPGDRGRVVRFRRLPSNNRRNSNGRRSSRTEKAPGRGAQSGQAVRHRLCGLRRTQPVQHGLHLHPENRRRAGACGAKGRRRGLCHRLRRRARFGQRSGRFRAPRPGPPDRVGADRCRSAWPRSQRYICRTRH